MSLKLVLRQSKQISLLRLQTRTFASNVKFTKSHEYIKLENDIGTIGITGKWRLQILLKYRNLIWMLIIALSFYVLLSFYIKYIVDHAAAALGDIVFVELPAKGIISSSALPWTSSGFI